MQKSTIIDTKIVMDYFDNNYSQYIEFVEKLIPGGGYGFQDGERPLRRV
jgi:hypothetical protein